MSPALVVKFTILMLPLLVTFAHDKPRHHDAPVDKPVTLQSEVREIITPKCGSCHTSTLRTAKQKAVAVFDLAREDWSSTMSSHQLESFETRLKSLDDSLKVKVRTFVKSELLRRNPLGM